MSTLQRQKHKLRSTINEHLIPEQGVFGEIWHARAEDTLWYTTRDGFVVSLSDVLNNIPAHTPPRAGRDGVDGRDGAKGERGACGEASTVPGPKGDKGDTVKGDKGDRGGRGEKGDTVVGPDSFAVLAEARAELGTVRREFADLKLIVDAVYQQNSQAKDYIEWLRAKVAARRKS